MTVRDGKEASYTVNRRPARSGHVDYSQPVVLHESSRGRIVLVPFFIRHSDRSELAAKLVTYSKQQVPFAFIEDKSITLSEAATRRLLSVLQANWAVAEENSDGNFLVIRVVDGSAQLEERDSTKIVTALTQLFRQQDIVAHLQNAELAAEITSAFRGAIRLNEMRNAVAELRVALDSGDTSESTYQAWCERHAWAFGNAYVVRDEVRNISPGDSLDLLLPNVIAGYRDLVELKRPDMPVLLWDQSHRNYYFSSEVAKAIGQCHRYLDVLQEVAANGLRDHPEVVAYHPRATVVIGRSHDWPDRQQRALHGLNRRLSGVNIMTYDHLLAQGERLLSMLSALPEETDIPIVDDEAIPF